MENALRRLPLEGLYNARELGGFPTKDGRVTRYGRFIRCEVPRSVTPSDLDYLRAYGVTRSVDLRGYSEVARMPSMLKDQDWCDYRHEPMFNLQVSMGAVTKDDPPKPDKYAQHPSSPVIDWGKLYVGMMDEYTDWTRRVMTLAAETEGVMLYHCTTGKDRTGMLTALLLSVAGVPEDDIIADYCVSQVYMRPVFLELLKLLPPHRDEQGNEFAPSLDSDFFRTAPENMRTLLTHLNEKYGSVTDYIRACGVTEDVIGAVRRKLTE